MRCEGSEREVRRVSAHVQTIASSVLPSPDKTPESYQNTSYSSSCVQHCRVGTSSLIRPEWEPHCYHWRGVTQGLLHLTEERLQPL